MSARFFRLTFALFALLELAGASAVLGQGSEGLRPQLTPVAQDIAAVLKGEGESSVSVGAFVAPPQQEAGTGPALSVRLVPELEKLGIKVVRRARLGVQGRFAIARNRKGHLVGKITVEVVDASGKVLKDFPKEVHFHATSDKPGPDSTVGDLDGICTIAALTAPTVELPPDKNQKVRHKILDERLKNPRTFLAGTRIQAGTKSPYAIEIVVADKARPARRGRPGLSAVEARRPVRGAAYQRFGPRRGGGPEHRRPGAVRLQRGGSELCPRHGAGAKGFADSRLVSHAGQVEQVQGGRLRGQSGGAAVVPAASVGAITASFALAWKKDAEPPADELAFRLLLRRGDRLATGRGPDVEQKSKQVEATLALCGRSSACATRGINVVASLREAVLRQSPRSARRS